MDETDEIATTYLNSVLYRKINVPFLPVQLNFESNTKLAGKSIGLSNTLNFIDKEKKNAKFSASLVFVQRSEVQCLPVTFLIKSLVLL